MRAVRTHRDKRAALAAAVGACLLALAWTRAGAHDAAAIIDSRVHDATQQDARTALLRRAEAELARGDATAAGESFERAAMMLHAPDTEMGLVRSYMQAGHYRRALAFCAHTAGVHREAPAAGALYAWLLRAGGQAAFAERTLNDTLSRAPQDPVVLATRRAFAAALPLAAGPLLEIPQRMAPQAVMLGGQSAPPEAARVVSSGVLIGDGRLALVPVAATRATPGAQLWVRNGLGQTTRARLDSAAARALDPLGVALLRLDAPMDVAGLPPAAPREPFAGSPGFALQFAISATAAPAWPWLRQGFIGAASAGRDGARRLGIELAEGSAGGPVFDAHGRLAGIALPGAADGGALLLSAVRWQSLLPEPDPAAAPQPPAPGTAPADQVYESGLRLALQLIATP